MIKTTKAKGEYGYINKTKRQKLVLTIMSFMAVLVFFATGIIIYHTNKSIFSVIAAVSVLPAAKLLTMYIAMAPYKTGDEKLYKTVIDIAERNKEYSALIGADFIISSPEKSMGVEFAYIINGKVICYADTAKISSKEKEIYIKKILDDNNCQYSIVRVYDDTDKYTKHVNAICMETGKDYTDKRIFEAICAYSI